jgi:8-oxo-dGTP pyrophosphatase MutT (NUDIX family)
MSSVRLAATVMLARPPFQLYMTRRSASSAFAPDAFVFPGGTIEPQDASRAAQDRTLGLERERIDREFRASVSSDLACDEPAVDRTAARTLLVTALRELFEEAGVLFARSGDGVAIDAGSIGSERIARERIGIREGTLTFAQFLDAHDWYADARALTLFSHWITPRTEPRRYNTHFFFAVAPPDQAAIADTVETHDGRWIAPSDALARYRRGELHLVYPTIKHLERLATCDSLDAALAFARAKPVVTILPNDAGADFAIPATLEDAW